MIIGLAPDGLHNTVKKRIMRLKLGACLTITTLNTKEKVGYESSSRTHQESNVI